MDLLINRFLHAPSSAIHYYWFLSFAVIGFFYVLFQDSVPQDILRKFKKFISSEIFLREFRKDIFFFSLRFIYRPLLFVFFALNLNEIESGLFSLAREWGIGFSRPIFHLDPLIGSFLVASLIFLSKDLIGYILHRLQHSYKIFWYFHMTHHFALVLNPLTKYRIHPVEYLQIIFIPLLLELPVALFIFKAFLVHGEGMVFSLIMIATYVLHNSVVHLRHSHIPIHYGFFSHFLVSPAMHQLHHSRERKHFDKNLGVIFSFWDRLGGTLLILPKEQTFHFGIKGYERILMGRSYVFELLFPFILISRDLRKFRRKLFAKKTLKASEKKSLLQGPYRASGFTLTEVLVATFIFSMMALVGSAIIIQFTGYSKNQGQINESETNLDLMVAHLKEITTRGVNVRRALNSSLNGAQGSATGEGFVRPFTYDTDTSWVAGRNAETLMFFARETAKSQLNPATLQSEYRPTGVFFVRKNESTDPAVRATGMIVIDLGNGIGSGPVSSNGTNRIEFKHVSDVVIDQLQYGKSDVLLSARMKVTMIYPVLTAGPGLDCLGPTRDILSGRICQGNQFRAHKTIERTFTLTFPNNKRDIAFSGAEFENGLYIFPPVRGR